MNTLEDLVKKVDVVRKQIACSRHEPFYRGHSHGAYTLVPSFLRLSGDRPEWRLKIEANLYAEFVSRAPREILRDAQNSWMKLAAMQHYGVPTRLLDWTSSLGVALYFALHPSHGKLDLSIRDSSQWPCIWVLNPWDLNDIALGKRAIFDEADHVPFDYYEAALEFHRNCTTWPTKYPIAIHPGWSNGRVFAQKGCFTCHGSDVRPLEEIVKDKRGTFWHLKRIPIPPSAVNNLRRSLRGIGASHYDIYPDAEGYAKLLREKFKL
jgi:hypothetical protein